MDGKWEIQEYTIILKSPDDVYFYVSMLAKEALKSVYLPFSSINFL